MFITVKCRGHEDGKRFELKGGSLVSNVPLHPSGRKSFRKTDDETLEQFEELSNLSSSMCWATPASR